MGCISFECALFISKRGYLVAVSLWANKITSETGGKRNGSHPIQLVWSIQGSLCWLTIIPLSLGSVIPFKNWTTSFFYVHFSHADWSVEQSRPYWSHHQLTPEWSHRVDEVLAKLKDLTVWTMGHRFSQGSLVGHEALVSCFKVQNKPLLLYCSSFLLLKQQQKKLFPSPSCFICFWHPFSKKSTVYAYPKHPSLTYCLGLIFLGNVT